jgi:hypothetical protein
MRPVLRVGPAQTLPLCPVTLRITIIKKPGMTLARHGHAPGVLVRTLEWCGTPPLFGPGKETVAV